MNSDDSPSWYPDDDRREAKDTLRRELDRRRREGEILEPLVAPAGSRALVKSFWAKAWCRHLESYQDYESRLPRGRSYLRQGRVYNLGIEPSKISAEVAGSRLYTVSIKVAPLDPDRWAALCKACSGQVHELLDLLAGKLGEGVLKMISDGETGLFPEPREIRFVCSCPDWAGMCKHVAAVLYGVAVKFDADPGLFFHLRGVDPAEMIGAGSLGAVTRSLGEDAEALAGEDLGALFGIDLAEGEAGAAGEAAGEIGAPPFVD